MENLTVCISCLDIIPKADDNGLCSSCADREAQFSELDRCSAIIEKGRRGHLEDKPTWAY